MRQRLALNENQETQVGEINLKYARKNEIVATSNGNRMSKMQSVKANRDRKNADMKMVLDETQYQKYLGLQEENAERRKQERNH